MSAVAVHLLRERRDGTDCDCPDCVSLGGWSYAHGHDSPSCRYVVDVGHARRQMAACPRCNIVAS